MVLLTHRLAGSCDRMTSYTLQETGAGGYG